MKKRIKQFAKFVDEDKNKPYRLLILSANDIHDPNRTGPLLREKAREMNLEVYLADFQGAFTEVKDGVRYFNSFPVSDDGAIPTPTGKEPVEYDKPFRMNPENTLVMMRGLNAKSGCKSWFTMARTLEMDGYTVVNSVLCNEICNDKWYNQMMFQQNDIRTPNTVLVRHKEGGIFAADKLNAKYPMILKTSTGSQGVGVMYVESDKALHGIVQLLYREDKYVDILLQELIKTDYDVRVIVVGDQILGAMKRPIIKGDFRSNVSQGSEPEVHELTELEKTESLRAAKAVDGDIVGVDFIPAKDREKENPYFIEVNSTPGLMGIESTFANSVIPSKLYKQTLKKERGKLSITKEILRHYLNRENWKKNN